MKRSLNKSQVTKTLGQRELFQPGMSVTAELSNPIEINQEVAASASTVKKVLSKDGKIIGYCQASQLSQKQLTASRRCILKRADGKVQILANQKSTTTAKPGEGDKVLDGNRDGKTAAVGSQQIVKTVGGNVLIITYPKSHKTAKPVEGAKVLDENWYNKITAAGSKQTVQIEAKSAHGKVQITGLLPGQQLVQRHDGKLQILAYQQSNNTNPCEDAKVLEENQINIQQKVQILKIAGKVQVRGILLGQQLVQLPDGKLQIFACQQSTDPVEPGVGAKVLGENLLADGQYNMQSPVIRATSLTLLVKTGRGVKGLLSNH